jgi:hypothetical protein
MNRLGDRNQPRSQAPGILKAADLSPGEEECLLGQVLRAMGIAGFQVKASEDHPAGSPDEFLERRPLATPAAGYQNLIGFIHASLPSH